MKAAITFLALSFCGFVGIQGAIEVAKDAIEAQGKRVSGPEEVKTDCTCL